jgi:hypothetical protein
MMVKKIEKKVFFYIYGNSVMEERIRSLFSQHFKNIFGLPGAAEFFCK